MLRLRVRIERIDRSKRVEAIAIANSGFIGFEPEILLPQAVAKRLELHEVGEPETRVKVTGDGREVSLLVYREAVMVYVIAEDRVEGPVAATAVVSPGARYVLLNDKLAGRLKIVLLDFGEGTWCFRDELGKRERSSL